MMLELHDLSLEIAGNMRLDEKILMQNRPVSSVGRALVCRAGGRGLKHPGQTNNKGLKQLVRLYWLWLKILFRFTLSRHWAVKLSRWPCLLHPFLSIGTEHKRTFINCCSKRVGDVRRPQRRGLSLMGVRNCYGPAVIGVIPLRRISQN